MATLTQIVEPEWILPFEAMKVGDSFFIPTLRPAELIYSIDCGAEANDIRNLPISPAEIASLLKVNKLEQNLFKNELVEAFKMYNDIGKD